MTKISIIFLQIMIVLAGLGVLAFLLIEPHFEGRNAGVAFWQVYFGDYFLAYVYAASIGFFTALWQVFRLLSYIKRQQVFSDATLQSLRLIKYCGLALIGFVVIGLVILLISQDASEDRPPLLMMSLIASLISASIAATATIFENIINKALSIKSNKI